MTPPLHELLLIDDNPADVDLVRHTVRRLGLPVHVSIARDAEGATAMVRERVGISVQLPDLVLADLNLPGQSGLEMIAEWKTDPTLRLVPIVVLSSSRNPAEVRETYRLGCAAFLKKPGNLSGYRELMQTLSAFWFGAVSLPSRPG